MKQNTVRDRRVRNLMLQDDLALKLPDARCTAVVSYIEQGRVMLTGRYKLVIGVLARMDRQERKEAAVSG